MSIFYDEKETRSPEERREDMNRRIAEMARTGYEKAPRVRKIFDAAGVKPTDIEIVEDLQKLPVISREQVVAWEGEEPPYGGFCGHDVHAQRIFTSPGPVYEPHLDEGTLWARGYRAAGFSERDIVLNTFSYHMVAAGLTFHEGLRALGATVIPSGTSSTEQQLQLMADTGVTGYTGTPSFLMAIIKKAEEKGHDFAGNFSLRKACFVAEPLQPSLRDIFENTYGIDTYQMYGATEVGDIAYECREKKWWHIVEDVVVEIVDPETGEWVAPGGLGEVVVTRLNDVFFLFRFGTGDLSAVDTAACSCGRTSVRLCGISGRMGDAVKVRGLFIAPSQLARVKDIAGIGRFQARVLRKNFRDILEVVVELEREDRATMERLTTVFREICTLTPDRIERVVPGTLDESEGLIRDLRTWD